MRQTPWNRAQPALLDHEHDLPPKWDGEPVRWGQWAPGPGTMFVCHRRGFLATGCGRCGSLLMADMNTGFDRQNLIRLIVTRCPECSLDTVVDVVTSEVWDLDDTDYGDEGSVAL